MVYTRSKNVNNSTVSKYMNLDVVNEEINIGDAELGIISNAIKKNVKKEVNPVSNKIIKKENKKNIKKKVKNEINPVIKPKIENVKNVKSEAIINLDDIVVKNEQKSTIKLKNETNKSFISLDSDSDDIQLIEDNTISNNNRSLISKKIEGIILLKENTSPKKIIKRNLINKKSPNSKKKKIIKEKRLGRIRSSPSIKDRDRISRAVSQKIYLVSREPKMNSQQKTVSEKFYCLGSTGNVYTVIIDKKPRCDCPDNDKGNLCKHIFFVFLKVLKVSRSSSYYYQKALLSSELEEIFKNTDRRLDISISADPLVVKKLKELQNGKVINPAPKRSLGVDDNCLICYDSMNQSKEKLKNCYVCGNSIHEAVRFNLTFKNFLKCWKQWVNKNKKDKLTPLCVFCRAPHMGNISKDAYKSREVEGVYNLAELQQGLSRERETYVPNNYYGYLNYRRYH